MRKISATSIGPVARRVLDAGQSGVIGAVFSSVFYVESGGGLIAIGHRDTDPGPLTLVTDQAPLDWQRFGLTVGKKVNQSSVITQIPGQLSIAVPRNTDWRPPAFPTYNPDTVARGLTFLPDAEVEPSATGYGSVVKMPKRLPTEVAPLVDWLAKPQNQTFAQLIGRGSGLTPAGDDLIGGALIALHGVGQSQSARALWEALRPLARANTNAISYALMEACLLYTSPSPRDQRGSRMPSSA